MKFAKSGLNSLRYIIFFAILLTPFKELAIGISLVNGIAGLPFANPKVWDIEDNEKGDWLFFATNNGVLAYDGNMFDLYPLNNNSEVRSVNYDANSERLYVGGINEFGYFLPSANGILDYVCLSDSIADKKTVGNIWGIHPDNNNILVQSDHCIIIYDIYNPGKSKVIYNDEKVNCSAFINGTLYLGTEDGMKQLKDNKVVDVIGMENLRNTRIRSIVPYSDGLLIATANNGVFTYGQADLLRKMNFKVPIDEEVFACTYYGNNLAVGTIGSGIYLVNLETGEINRYNENNGLLNNTVLSLNFGKNGNLWIGHDGGIEELFVDFPLYTLTNGSLPIGHGYVSMVHDNRLWLGTNRGLYSVNLPLTYPLNFTPVGNLEGQSWGLRKIDGKLMLCHDHGLYEITDANKFNKIQDITGVWDIQPIASDNKKYLLGTYDGLFIVEFTGAGSDIIKLSGFSGSAYNFVQENDSVVWVCEGSEGIARLNIDYKNNQVISSERYVTTDNGVSFVGNNRICKFDNRPVFLTKIGILRYDKTNDKIIEDNVLNSYISTEQSCIDIKKSGEYIYLLTANSIVQINEVTNERKTIPLLREWIVSQHYGDMLVEQNPSELIIPTNDGYIHADFKRTMQLYKDLSLNPGKIDAVFSTSPRDSLIYRHNYLGSKPDIVLDYVHNSIKFLYGKESLTQNGFVQYRYRLNDDDWSDPTFVTSKEYTGLREGDYTFTLQTTYQDGMTEEDVFSFTISAPWYRTPAAYIVYSSILLGLVIMTIYYIRKKIREKEIKARIEEKRIQEAKIDALEKEKMQEDYNRKTKELTFLLINEANKNEILLCVRDGLNEIIKTPHFSSEHAKKVSALLERIKTGIHVGKTLEKFESEFNLLHNDFTRKLRLKYPSLSNREIILCSYVKMTMTSKEIAPLMNISLRGVETMRYRIREKLGLGQGASLSSFIANFA